jgi:hypothetical protein
METPRRRKQRPHGDERLDDFLVVVSVGGEGIALGAPVAPKPDGGDQAGEVPFDRAEARVLEVGPGGSSELGGTTVAPKAAR